MLSLSGLYNDYKLARKGSNQRKNYELEYIVIINKRIYNDILGNTYGVGKFIPDLKGKAVYYDVTNNVDNTKFVNRMIVRDYQKGIKYKLENAKYLVVKVKEGKVYEYINYTKLRKGIIKVSPGISCALSVEIASKPGTNILSSDSDTQVSERTLVKIVGGPTITLIYSQFIGRNKDDAISSYRVEIESPDNNTLEDWNRADIVCKYDRTK